jgi:hypothetical protein
MAKVLVSANWMKACGFEARDTEMEVISISAVTPAGDKIYKVIRPHDNCEWCVADWRLVDTRYWFL